jgi:transposase-like protein
VIKKVVYLQKSKRDSISKILELYYKLTMTEQAELLVKLNNESYSCEVKPFFENKCSHCESSKIINNGSVKGRKRYKCNSCGKTFGEYSNTVFSGIKKMDKFLLFKNIMMTEGVICLKTMCKRVGISIQTSFDWRHKLLGSLSSSDAKFKGDVEFDDIWVSYSQKGRKGLKYSKARGGSKKAGDNNFQVKILTATNKEQTLMKVGKIGRISKKDIEDNFKDKFSSDVKIISDSHPSIIGFAKDNNFKHVYFKAKDHVAKTGESVQFLNSQSSRFDTIINRILKGVSTKYLQNYANWFSFLETNKIKDVNKLATISILSDNHGWDEFTNMEQTYKEFIKNHSVRTYRCPTKRSWKSNNWNLKKVNVA